MAYTSPARDIGSVLPPRKSLAVEFEVVVLRVLRGVPESSPMSYWLELKILKGPHPNVGFRV